MSAPDTVTTQTLRCWCSTPDFTTAWVYDEAPEGEVRFDLTDQGAYRRELRRCQACGHYVSVHDMDMSALYEGQYVDATYGSDGLRRTFERIISLPPDQSDNAGRSSRIAEFAAQYLTAPSTEGRPPTLLDVGSGTGVFPYVMANLGFATTALDPDARAVTHLREVAGVDAIEGDFRRLDLSTLGRFDIVSFNKVLEHVEDPAAMLRLTRDLVDPEGLVYVELPDGEGAASEGFGREEFFIDHHHVFSAASMTMLVVKAGFVLLTLERVREPSTKFTLRAFLRTDEPRDGVR